MKDILTKLGIATTSSLVVTEAVNLEPLWNALITLAISIVSVLTVEGINWLKAYIKSKTVKDEKEDSKEPKE